MSARPTIRVLTAADVVSWQGLRLRSLLENPEAFGASFEEEKDTPIERLAERLRQSMPDTPNFGAFLGDTLVGICGLIRHARRKQHHRALIWGMYVTPPTRGQGLGKALLNHTLEYARQQGVEIVTLAVTVGNTAARRLYVSVGFQPYGVEPRYFKINGQYYDLEWMWKSLI